jgi:hypothetical protein
MRATSATKSPCLFAKKTRKDAQRRPILAPKSGKMREAIQNWMMLPQSQTVLGARQILFSVSVVSRNKVILRDRPGTAAILPAKVRDWSGQWETCVSRDKRAKANDKSGVSHELPVKRTRNRHLLIRFREIP